MEIQECMQRLHKAYKRGESSLGCVSRASILAYFMKSKGLHPEVKQFCFKNEKGEKKIRTHCVVICEGTVYDANSEASKNPISFEEYENMKKNQHPMLNMVWTNWDEDDEVDYAWNYLCNGCDEELQKELKPIMKPKYDVYLEKHPALRMVVYGKPS